MRKGKKINKFKISILIFLIVLLFTTTVFGRYIYNTVREAYFTSKQFYFSSDILTANGASYQYDNWGGVDIYEIGFDLYSYNNKLSKLNYDLEYTVTCESLSTDKITCSIGSVDGETLADGTIYVAQNNTSRVNIYVKPIADINKGETVKLKVTAKTKEPYVKEISCIFSLYLKLEAQNTYSIEDIKNRDYAILKMVNGTDTARPVTLTFDPSELRLDLNNEIYPNMTVLNKQTINGKEYVSKIEFNIPKEAAKNIKFYKVDKSKDYTYPKGASTSAITVNI